VQLTPGQAEDVDLAQQQLEQLQQFLEQQVRQQLPAGWDVRGVQMVGKGKKDSPRASRTDSLGTDGTGSGGKPPKDRSSKRHHKSHQLSAVAAHSLSAAANSLAAALACLWSREGEGQRGDITLQPLAAALPELPGTPTAAAAATASLSSGSSSNCSVVEVELLLSKVLVEQLLEQGHERVRCVVAAQPQGAVLLDQVWELLPSTTEKPAESAGDAAAKGTAAAAEATAAAAPAVAEDGLKLKLVFSREAALHLGSDMSQQGPVRVMSIVVLAKGHRKDSHRPCSSGTDSTSTCSRSTGSTGSSVLAAAAAAAAVSGAVVPGVIAHLPLLLLPAAAAKEMQGLFEAAVACGVDKMQANQQLLLRLVQDWALLMLLLDGSCGSDGSSSSSAAQMPSSNSMLRSPLQLMQQSLNDSLSSYFAQHKLEHCLKLLQSVAGAASNNAARAARLQRQQQQALQQQQQQQTYKPHFSADFYLYTFKIANCTAQHPHDWSTVSMRRQHLQH
jgi:hypothetical protein